MHRVLKDVFIEVRDGMYGRGRLFGFACAAFAALSVPVCAAELGAMSQADIRSLQQRLTDAKCYTGPLDGTASSATADAMKRCPEMNPILSIETGMHKAAISRVAVDRDCSLLATGSIDKTVRLWSLPEGKLLQTFRLPVGPTFGGIVYAIALSPKRDILVAGGFDARSFYTGKHSAYVFDVKSGELKARLGEFENTIVDLAFSPDGRHLVAALKGSNGIRVMDVARQQEVASDQAYDDDARSIAFAADGRLFTAAYDGYLRSYDSSFRITRKEQILRGKKPQGLAIHPSSKLLAIGYSDVHAVEIYRTDDLVLERTVRAAKEPSRLDPMLWTVAWSTDGGRLVAAGSVPHSAYTKSLLSWDKNGGGERKMFASNAVIMHVVSCGSGFALGSADSSFAILEQDGTFRLTKSSFASDFRGGGDVFQVSDNGKLVQFGLDAYGERPVFFDLERATLDSGAGPVGLVRAPPRNYGLYLTDLATEPKLNGQPVQLEQEPVLSWSQTQDAGRFAVGTGLHLRLFDWDRKLLWKRQGAAAALGVNVTVDGRLVTVAYGDGTIRWHRLSDGAELLALFVNEADLRWVAWTPSGYYMASPGAEDLIGWHVNRGWDQSPDFFSVSRFRDRLSRPDVVKQVLVTLDEGKAVEAANKAANVRPDTEPVTNRLPPVIRVLSPADGGAVREREITVEYELRSPSGLPVDTVEVLIDGRPSRGIKRLDTTLNASRMERQTVSLPNRDVELGLLARSGSLASEVAKIKLRWAGGGAGAAVADEQFKPKLYGVIVGVSAYADPALELKYAAKDARDFAVALQAQKGGLYRDVELKVLVDAEASNGAVKDALENLSRQVTSRDLGVVFLAGHGVQDSRNAYYFLAANSDRNRLLSTAVEGVVLREQLRSLSGKVLVFLDTCYAGQAMGPATRGAADINTLVNDLSSTENGVVTFASSTGREVSQEDGSWGNGAFTKALIEGLGAVGAKARADVTGKGVITTAALDLWVSERVKELTRGSQHPVMIRPPTVPDFPMFVVRN